MTILNLCLAFAGGIFASLIGGTNSFIFTGFTALAGIAISLVTGNDDFLNTVAFGPFFSPAIAFFGSVASTAFAARWSKREKGDEKSMKPLGPAGIEGQNLLMPLYKTKDPLEILVGGAFGSLGYSINYLYSQILHLNLDTVALTVFTGGVICRLLFGKKGLFGQYPSDFKRYSDMTPKYILFTVIWGFFIGLLSGYVAIKFNIASIGFAISAMSLIFLHIGHEFTSTHHVTQVAAYAGLGFANPWMAAIFGVIAALFGEYWGRTTNTFVDTHLDREGSTIALFSFIIFALTA